MTEKKKDVWFWVVVLLCFAFGTIGGVWYLTDKITGGFDSRADQGWELEIAATQCNGSAIIYPNKGWICLPKEENYHEVCECVENKTIEHAQLAREWCEENCFDRFWVKSAVNIEREYIHVSFPIGCPESYRDDWSHSEPYWYDHDDIKDDFSAWFTFKSDCLLLPKTEVRVWNETVCTREECTLKKVIEVTTTTTTTIANEIGWITITLPQTASNIPIPIPNSSCGENEEEVEVTCNCAKNTHTPCMAYCFECRPKTSAPTTLLNACENYSICVSFAELYTSNQPNYYIATCDELWDIIWDDCRECMTPSRRCMGRCIINSYCETLR